MDHHVEMLRTENEDPAIPTAYHATCACGWAAESHDQAHLQALARAHENGEQGIPVPASPSPVHNE